MALEGWVPEIGPSLSLAEVIEFAFDYRGNTTVVRRDGSALVGYLFNRQAGGPAPYVEMFDEAGHGPIRVPYADIATIKFTGKDTAAGNSWKAWVERREQERATGAGSTGAA
jgi:hypothetical protein